MSTFDGIVSEFPEIRIDDFRKKVNHPSPLACFLSHVHSDHLRGLESLRSPFVYCSPATKEILLRLERYQPRMNFNKKILESRVQTYKHLKGLLKSIPLNTPTQIELCLGHSIRVTLLDANHCIGAVMFLIEGNNRAILYTGDIRSETWWVNSLIRNPVVIPYTLGKRRLDRIYLDTTFAMNSNIYREFPSKAEGIREMLEQVERYPPDTIFYFHAWTFGYEDVWTALAAFLNSRIHLDRYRLSLYRSLARTGTAPPCLDAAQFCGFELGNHKPQGFVTSDPVVQVHSCERGSSCPIFDKDEAQRVVTIIPIVTRTKSGSPVPEIGAGGGQGDLDQTNDLIIDDTQALEQLIRFAQQTLQDSNPKLLQSTLRVLSAITRADGHKSIPLHELKAAFEDSADIPLEAFVNALGNNGSGRDGSADFQYPQSGVAGSSTLPATIRFPYSRHSSYTELCDLVKAFHPKDVYPCTIDVMSWDPSQTMRALFGHLCSADLFEHDKLMLDRYQEMQRFRSTKRRLDETQGEDRPQSSVNGHSSTQESTASPKKGRRSGMYDGSLRSNDEEPSYDFTQYATCDTQMQLDNMGDDDLVSFERDPPYEHSYDTLQQIIFHDLQTESLDTDISIAATTGADTQAHLSPSFLEPQIPQRSFRDRTESQEKESPTLLVSSSPFSRAAPAAIFETDSGPNCSPSTSKLITSSKARNNGRLSQANVSKKASLPSIPSTVSTNPPSGSLPSRINTQLNTSMSALSPNYVTRKLAHDLAMEYDELTWFDFEGLVSAGNNHCEEEVEL
ncbi:hypothetical protein EJ05DRAFT_537981 [Pseudovirgaria hyperparasitica]|uniref:Protein artemis n=1 Tax=Pseudovirgaria hyperparasitica TaxID=470096 RepID=A0A6A6W7Y8_9PEZI|nr:uncharacterized protein EJ05DRAFT_537981 [Pseudovirgaria hyperparasitica]KAF2758655.1 hypothetical protein EJ05DRAFT_537981 [Pseudovirgaria hyperparasitica]